MDTYTLRLYWLSKYENKFHESYKPKKAKIESFLLSYLLKTYNQFLILEAIDNFFLIARKEQANILLFASKKYFTSAFRSLIKEKDVVQYNRMILWYSKENQERVKNLIQLYKHYIYAISLSSEDIEIMKVIINELKNIEMEN